MSLRSKPKMYSTSAQLSCIYILLYCWSCCVRTKNSSSELESEIGMRSGCTFYPNSLHNFVFENTYIDGEYEYCGVCVKPNLGVFFKKYFLINDK